MENADPTWSTESLREIIARDDARSLKAALDQGLNPKTWLDVSSRDTLPAIAILEDGLQCVELLLEKGGDWAVEAPFDEDQESPLGIATQIGSEPILQAFINL